MAVIWDWLPFMKKGLAGKTYAIPYGEPVDRAGAPYAQDWQKRAWDLWDCIGELHSPTSYVADAVASRMGWKVDDLDPEESLAYLQETLGNTDISEFIRLNCLNYQGNGETWVLQYEDGFDVKSVADPDLKKAIERSIAYVRVYKAHPRNTELADCAMKTVLDPAEELSVLSALNRSQSRSRIANVGVWLYPSQQQSEGGNPFATTLPEAMKAAIKDVSSPAAWSPIVHKMDKDLIATVRHVTPDRSYDDKVQQKIDQCIRRIALGLDIPPELLMGIGSSSNHWGAWISQDETINGTLMPLSSVIAGIFEWCARVKTYGPQATSDAEVPMILPDPTAMQARRATPSDAIQGAGIGAVGLAYVRTTMGADDGDAATADDLRIMALARGMLPAPAESEGETQTTPNDGDPPDESDEPASPPTDAPQ